MTKKTKTSKKSNSNNKNKKTSNKQAKVNIDKIISAISFDQFNDGPKEVIIKLASFFNAMGLNVYEDPLFSNDDETFGILFSFDDSGPVTVGDFRKSLIEAYPGDTEFFNEYFDGNKNDELLLPPITDESELCDECRKEKEALEASNNKDASDDSNSDENDNKEEPPTIDV